MGGVVVLPFCTLTDRSVMAGKWNVSVDDAAMIELASCLKSWDSSSKVQLKRSVKIDWDLVSRELGVSGVCLQLHVVVGTGSGKIPRIILNTHSHNLEPDTSEYYFDEYIGPRQLSSAIFLDTIITLANQASVESIISPSLPGSRLWSERVRIALGSDESQFPMEVINFADISYLNIPAGALWFLHWSAADWDRQFSSAVRLYLNSSAPSFVEKVKASDPLILQMLMSEVMHQICERLLHEYDFDTLSNTPAISGSLLDVAYSWIRQAWPGMSLGFVKTVLDQAPGEFSAKLNALAEIEISEEK